MAASWQVRPDGRAARAGSNRAGREQSGERRRGAAEFQRRLRGLRLGAHLEAQPCQTAFFRGPKGGPCSLLAGLACIASGIFHTCLLVKFTPVYRATECGDETAMLDRFELANSVDIGMDINVTCRNPNPYKITILESSPGRVFIGVDERGSARVEVGTLKVLSGSYLQERGVGLVSVRLDAQLSDRQANALLPHLLEDQSVKMFMELQFRVGVSISFGLGRWGSWATYDKKCGLRMAGLLVNRFKNADQKSRLGPLVCRKSFQGMDIPEVGEVERLPEDGRMGFTGAQVAPQEVSAGELTKNLSLLTAMLLSYTCGLALVYGAWKSAGEPLLPEMSCRLCSLSAMRKHQWTPVPPRGYSGYMRSLQEASSPGEQAAMLRRWDEDSAEPAEPHTGH